MSCSHSKLEQARAYETREGAQIPAQDRPQFHLTPWVGWMNDPTGFVITTALIIYFTNITPMIPFGGRCTGGTLPVLTCCTGRICRVPLRLTRLPTKKAAFPARHCRWRTVG